MCLNVRYLCMCMRMFTCVCKHTVYECGEAHSTGCLPPSFPVLLNIKLAVLDTLVCQPIWDSHKVRLWAGHGAHLACTCGARDLSSNPHTCTTKSLPLSLFHSPHPNSWLPVLCSERSNPMLQSFHEGLCLRKVHGFCQLDIILNVNVWKMGMGCVCVWGFPRTLVVEQG